MTYREMEQELLAYAKDVRLPIEARTRIQALIRHCYGEWGIKFPGYWEDGIVLGLTPVLRTDPDFHLTGEGKVPLYGPYNDRIHVWAAWLTGSRLAHPASQILARVLFSPHSWHYKSGQRAGEKKAPTPNTLARRMIQVRDKPALLGTYFKEWLDHASDAEVWQAYQAIIGGTE